MSSSFNVSNRDGIITITGVLTASDQLECAFGIRKVIILNSCSVSSVNNKYYI